jgi:hypothetical protein
MRLSPALKISWLLVLLAFGALATNVSAAAATVKLTLVWGTDEEKPNDPKLKPANKDMVAQLREAVKWKYYFEVTNSVAVVTANTCKIRLSPKCELELQDAGKDGMAARFLGEGKEIWKGKVKLETGKNLVIGGSDKNATAWFVALTPQ